MSLTVNQLIGFGVGADAPPPDAFTKLLLHMEGADASTTFTDSSASAHTVTASGSAQVDTAQAQFGSASALFSGGNHYLQLDGSADFAFGTADFTIDFWARFSTVSGLQVLYDSRPASTQGDYVLIRANGTGVYLVRNTVNVITSSGVIATGAWYHIALSRSGNDHRMFVNGTQVGSTWTNAVSWLNPASRPLLGRSGWTNEQGLNGWIDELRISTGIARWTANFTPPTAPY